MVRAAVMALWFGMLPLAAGELTIGEDSVMAVVTHKAGIAKGLAHNHFIYPGAYQATMTANAGETDGIPADLDLTLTIPTADLVVDDFTTNTKWYPRLEALGLLSEPFRELKEKDRKKIRKAMLGKSQLNESKHKEITVELQAVTATPAEVDGQAFAYEIQAAFTIVGRTVDTTLAANIDFTDGKLQLEGVGSLEFSDFDIEPYSALLGAISNQDTFHLYVSLQAE